MKPYPSEPDEIRRILMAHLESTVHWMNNVRTLWNDYGIRLFVEIGPGDILSNLIADTLPEPACVQTCIPEAESITYRAALAQLFAQGHLKVEKEPRFVSISAATKAAEPGPAAPSSALRPSEAGLACSNQVERIIQTEINRFMIDTFGQLLKPGILESIRRKVDPAFQESDLASAIKSMLGGFAPVEGSGQVAPVKPSSAPADAAAVIPAQVLPAIGEATEQQDITEKLIRIIMDATGYERDEIKPEMDLRRNLSIRSSRLPIIMDSAEHQFGITINLEDFVNVRTIRDFAQKIADIIAKQKGPSQNPAARTEAGQAQDEIIKPSEEEVSLKRLVFKCVPVEPSASAPIELSQGESVLCLSPDRDDKIAKNVGEIFRRDYGADTIPMLFMQDKIAGQEGFDILTDAGSRKVSERISSLASLAGMVITLPKGWSKRLKGIVDVSRLLRGLFLPLKAFLQSPAKKFVVLIHSREDTETLGRLLAEGMLGMFLSAAQEYSSVQFRTLEIDRDTDLRTALLIALDKGYTAVEMIHRDGKVFTSEGHVAPSIFGNPSSLNLNPGDVVVMSGGASGISAHLARGLVPFRPRIVFLGRTAIDTANNSAKTASGRLPSEASTSGRRASEIAQTLADLHSSGIEATYYTCDVTDPKAVRDCYR